MIKNIFQLVLINLILIKFNKSSRSNQLCQINLDVSWEHLSFLNSNFFWSKFFLDIMFFDKLFFKNCLTRNILVLKFVNPSLFSQLFWIKICFNPKRSFDPKFFWTNLFLTFNFFYSLFCHKFLGSFFMF